jgi:hypothetical protein
MSLGGSPHNNFAKIWRGTRSLSKYRLVMLLLMLAAAVVIADQWLISRSPAIFLDGKNDADAEFNSRILSDYKNIAGIPYCYSQPFSKEKPAGVRRIFLIGEASLAGWPFGVEEAVDRKIRNNLATYSPDTKFEVITISFAGLNSTVAAEIVSRIFRYSPDLLILYSGHNEFYGEAEGLRRESIFSEVSPKFIRRLFSRAGDSVPIPYDSNTDDLELLIALHAKDKLINSQQPEYRNAVERYEANMARIAGLCKDHHTGLIVSDLADNYQLPPVGISNSADPGAQLSADIIFNNARMALQRDGNERTADTLFFLSKELDAFRLRVPGDLLLCLKKMARDSSMTIASLHGRFDEISQNHIPGNDLFVDYIHPNKKGLDIIAAEYTRLILNKFSGGRIDVTVAELMETERKMTADSGGADVQLEKRRIEKTMCRIKDAHL